MITFNKVEKALKSDKLTEVQLPKELQSKLQDFRAAIATQNAEKDEKKRDVITKNLSTVEDHIIDKIGEYRDLLDEQAENKAKAEQAAAELKNKASNEAKLKAEAEAKLKAELEAKRIEAEQAAADLAKRQGQIKGSLMFGKSRYR